MSSSKPPARLVAVCQKEQVALFDTRQIPINIDENLIVNNLFNIKKTTKRKNFFIFFLLH
jgi:hypothetical protein